MDFDIKNLYKIDETCIFKQTRFFAHLYSVFSPICVIFEKICPQKCGNVDNSCGFLQF